MHEEENSKKQNGDESNRENSSSEQERNKEKNNHNNQPSVWEWIMAGVGLVLVVGVLGFLLYKAIWGSEQPPDVRVQLETVEQVSNGYLVKFRALNSGSATAAGVSIEAELMRGGEKMETDRTTIDFLPAHSVRRGGFFFRNDPREFELEMRAVGFQEP